MIDEKKLLGFQPALINPEAQKTKEEKMFAIGWNECNKYWIRTIMSQPPADVPDTNVGEWIPCSERLPEEPGQFIVTVKIKDKYTGACEYKTDTADFVECGGYIDGKWDTYNDWAEGNECHVTAWDDLPEPYKGVE